MSESTLITSRAAQPIGTREGRVTPRALVSALASVRLTLAGLALLGLAAIATSQGVAGGQGLVALPLLLLALNLVAALGVNPLFRVKPLLFGMHVGLLLLALAVALGQLTRLRGHFEISEGQAFDPALLQVDSSGPWQPELPAEGAFRQGRIEVNYAPGLMRRESTSRVSLPGGGQASAMDGQPLIIDGYRFYLTHNKGFAAHLVWEQEGTAEPQRGAVHFPSYPRLAPQQHARWTTPGGSRLELRLEPLAAPAERAWTLRRQQAGERLWVRQADGSEIVLTPGQRLVLPGGTLLLEDLRLWLGYRVYYDPSLPWVFAGALLTLVMLAAHLWGRFARPLPEPLSAHPQATGKAP